jgi:hypothetical protein
VAPQDRFPTFCAVATVPPPARSLRNTPPPITRRYGHIEDVSCDIIVSLTLACSHRHVRSVPSIVVDHSTFLPDTNPDFHHGLLKE